jgi:hypothetical protein
MTFTKDTKYDIGQRTLTKDTQYDIGQRTQNMTFDKGHKL